MRLRQLPRHLVNLMIIGIFLGHSAQLWKIPVLENLEHIGYDARLNLTLENRRDPGIVILDIDEKSLAMEGRWPWPRERLAYMIDLLFEYYQVGVLAMDVVFSEPDTSSGLPLLEMLAKGPLRQNSGYMREFLSMAPELDYDAVFARSLKNRNVVLGWFGTDDLIDGKPIEFGQLPQPVMMLDERLKRIPLVESQGYGANLPVLQSASASGGFFHNPLVDRDGKFRRIPIVVRDGDRVYESLSLAVVRRVLGTPEISLQVADGFMRDGVDYGLEAVRVDSLSIPVDPEGGVLVPYLGKQGSFPYLSLTDVLNAQVDPKQLENAIVIIGATAAGLLDLRSTPVQNVYPGVEIQANLISGILEERIKHRPVWVQGVEFAILLITGLLFSLAATALAPVFALLLTVIFLFAVTWVNFYLWTEFDLATNYAMVLMLVATLIFSDLFFGFFLEQRQKRKLGHVFGQYVPPQLVEEMSERPESFGLEGESRQMSVLFSDVRGFTTISEGLEPSELTRIINNILTPLTRVIHENRGTIDKYMGDAIMAFWGAPLHDDDHAAHAVEAGLKLLKATDVLREEFVAKGWPPIRVGVGVNTGVMCVGNMGSEFRMAYTVMGDTVNLGSRLEGLTKQYGVSMLVSEFVVSAAPGFVYRELDRVRVKGKEEPVVIYEPLGKQAEVSDAVRQEVARHTEALRLYRAQEWESARALFRKLRSENPATLIYTIYIDRIQHFRDHPPGEDWDGVYTHTSK